MLRAMVVDDEKMICQLILRLVDWDKRGVQVVGVAHNGESALALARKEKPDIMITDIRIPVFDGLELISRVRQFAPQTRFIVISGYRHFEYAHSALRYGVTDYLLKPINADELDHALAKLAADILRERSDQASRAELTEQLSVTGARMRQQFFSDFVEGHVAADKCSVRTLNGEYGYALREAPVGLFIIKVSCLNMEDYDLMPLVFSRTVPIVQGVLQPACTTFEVLVVQSRLYCLYQFAAGGERSSRELQKLYQRIADQFDDVLNAFESFALTLCPAMPAPGAAGLPHALQAAEHAVHFRLYAVQARIVDLSAATYCRRLNIDAVFSRGQQALFCTLLQSGEREKLEENLRQVFTPFRRAIYGQFDPEILFELCAQLVHLVRVTLESASSVLDLSAVERAVDHACSVHALLDQFTAALLDALEPYFALSAAKTGAPIQKAIGYIESHYADPLTLDAVAAQTGLSPAYLSTLFKKETGSTFGEYLTLCRMNAAKHLLRHTSEPVASIAEQTGYVDAKYFSKVFAKAFGISPQKYRNL